jgi:hypothetical protein
MAMSLGRGGRALQRAIGRCFKRVLDGFEVLYSSEERLNIAAWISLLGLRSLVRWKRPLTLSVATAATHGQTRCILLLPFDTIYSRGAAYRTFFSASCISDTSAIAFGPVLVTPSLGLGLDEVKLRVMG